MNPILFIKRNQQLLTEESIKRENFRFIQDQRKAEFRKVVDNSEFGGLINDEVLNVIRDEKKFLSTENFQKLFEFAALIDSKWKKTSLRLFYIKPPEYESQIIRAFGEWTTYTGIEFVMAHGLNDSDIRISFEEDGHWSYIGTQAEQGFLTGKATMNFDPMDFRGINDKTRYSIMLHEIGHSIGLIHEHQKETSPIIWNKAKIYNDCQRIYGWDKVEVDHNIFNKFNSNDLFYSKEFDRNSIMIYAIPNGWSSNYQINEMNNELSELDKRFARAFYS
jgi:hypothetical protein